MEWSRFALLALLASCATASSDDDGNVAPTVDSGTSGFLDAKPRPDAAQTSTPDAAPNITYDAAPIEPDAAAGLFCEDSNECESGDCCLTLGGSSGVCVRGEEILGACLPD